MGKLLFWLIVIFVVLMVARILAQKARSAKQPPVAPPSAKHPLHNPPNESMVRCAHCGIHLPRSDAVLVQGQTWCSEEHAKLGVRR